MQPKTLKTAQAAQVLPSRNSGLGQQPGTHGQSIFKHLLQAFPDMVLEDICMTSHVVQNLLKRLFKEA